MTTLDEARQQLREAVDEGAACPCCGQFAKVYRRKIHATMAAQLVVVWRSWGTEWFHLPSALPTGRGGDFCKLVHWGLLEEDDAVREDGSRRNGWHRVTPDGESYVRGRLRVPKYARIYDGRCLGLTGDPVGVRDALGTRFDYNELMSGL